MTGLSSLYIKWKLTVECTNTATQNQILQYGSVANAVEIVGNEPKEGPILEDPTEGDGDQIRDYDIGIDVAQRIITNRNTLAGFTNLSQLAGISYFGKDKQITYCFLLPASFMRSVPSVSTDQIYFQINRTAVSGSNV
jgi:hypothetical protein